MANTDLLAALFNAASRGIGGYQGAKKYNNALLMDQLEQARRQAEAQQQQANWQKMFGRQEQWRAEDIAREGTQRAEDIDWRNRRAVAGDWMNTMFGAREAIQRKDEIASKQAWEEKMFGKETDRRVTELKTRLDAQAGGDSGGVLKYLLDIYKTTPQGYIDKDGNWQYHDPNMRFNQAGVLFNQFSGLAGGGGGFVPGPAGSARYGGGGQPVNTGGGSPGAPRAAITAKLRSQYGAQWDQLSKYDQDLIIDEEMGLTQ